MNMEKVNKIAAIVVTYNRLIYLQKCIYALCHQTYKLDAIFIINNGSNDGTKEWLDSQSGLTVIHQDNVGGSGGFHRGIKEAFEAGFDLIWAMDDDVNPTPDCLSLLLSCSGENIGIRCPQRKMNGKIVLGETLRFNLSNPFKPLKRNLTLADVEKGNTIDIEGMAFEGPLIHSNVVRTIGLPNKDLFIFWDDTDYSYRAHIAGFKVVYVNNAILNKEDLSNAGTSQQAVRSWKVPYGLRNLVYFCHSYGENKFFRIISPFLIFSRYVIGVIKHLVRNDKYYKLTDLKMIARAYKDGIKGNLGKY